MAASQAVLANKALALLGHFANITTLSTDTTAEGGYCRTFLDDAILETLKGAPWRCARKVATLTLDEELEQTRDEPWTYSYRLPEDCLQPRFLRFYGQLNPNPDQEIPFDLYPDVTSAAWAIGTTYATGEYASVTTTGTTVWYRALRETVGDAPASSASDWVAITGGPPKFLHTNLEDAVLEYTRLLTDPTRFDEDLDAAVCARLALDIAPSVTVGNSRTLLEVAAKYEALLSKAVENDRMGRKVERTPISTWELARHRPGVR